MRIVLVNALLTAQFALPVAGRGAPTMAWQWSNPRPSGNNLVQVAFQDSVHGLIVADNGEVSETGNGGETWRIRGGRIEKDVLITAVALDDRTILASSGLGKIWRTTDGGMTWTTAATYPNTLVSLAACGDSALLAVGMGGLIVRSADRGATWASVQPSDEGPYLLGIHCDDRQAFAVGESGRVLRSRDQGQTWDSLARPLREFLTGVAFADSSHGIVTTDRGRLAETRDGGRTWKVKVLDTMHYLGAIRREGSRWRVTGSEGSIWTSQDAGTTWIRSEPMTSMHLSSAAFVGRAGGVAVGNNGLILKEKPGGGDWRIIGQESIQYLDGLARISPTSWLAFGAPGALLKSTDAGTTWTKRQPAPDSVRYLAGAFQGAHGLVAGEKGTISLSRNGGETWEAVATPRNNLRLYGIAWGDSRSATAVGERAAIWRTADAGLTWTEVPRPAGLDSQTLSAVSFRPDGTGFIVGYEGAILRSANRGESWSMVPSPVQEDLYGLAFRDDAIGLAVGAHGTVLATLDAGATWMHRTIRPRPGDDFVLSVAWLAGDTALAVGDWGHGWFLRLTTDAGATWSEEPLPTRKWGWALAGLGDGKAAVLGQDGVILIGSLRGEGGGARPDPSPYPDGPFSVQRTGEPGQILFHLTLGSARKVTITAASPDGRLLGVVFRGELGRGLHALRVPGPRRGPTLFRVEGTGPGPRLKRSGFLPY